MLPYLCQVIASLEAKPFASLWPLSHQLSQQFVWQANIDPLLWLDAQPLYPKCYWQSRDGQEEVIALGKVAHFDDAKSAESSLQGEQRVWGGRAFSQTQGCQNYFFLPLLELVRVGKKWTLHLNLSAKSQPNPLASLSFKPSILSEPNEVILSKTHLPEFDQWSTMVTNALEEIASNKLQKVVLARKTSVHLSNAISAAALLYKSRQTNENQFHFLLSIDEKQSFIGSSPERLFQRTGNHFSTEALAGTIGRAANSKEDQRLAHWLLTDSKSLHENQLVVDDIIERLSSFSLLEVAPNPSVNYLRHILHLKRLITGVITTNSALNSSMLLEALQPTAAIAGLPRKQALDHITQNELFDRQWYSGSIGFMRKTQSEFCVAIRSALVLGEQIHFYAGAGIVEGSVPSLEWNELDKKLFTLLDLLDEKHKKQGLRA